MSAGVVVDHVVTSSPAYVAGVTCDHVVQSLPAFASGVTFDHVVTAAIPDTSGPVVDHLVNITVRTFSKITNCAEKDVSNSSVGTKAFGPNPSLNHRHVPTLVTVTGGVKVMQPFSSTLPHISKTITV